MQGKTQSYSEKEEKASTAEEDQRRIDAVITLGESTYDEERAADHAKAARLFYLAATKPRRRERVRRLSIVVGVGLGLFVGCWMFW